MKRILCIFLFLALFSLSALAADMPTLTKYVNDYANVLSDSEEAQINSLCAHIEENWTVEIAVLTVNTTQPLSIEEYAVETFAQNGIGKADTDNGLLIVAAISDRQWRFEVGYGLEGVLNDAKVGRIGRTYLTPNFQNGEYGLGLYEAVDAVGQVIANGGDDSFISDQSGANEKAYVFVIMSVFFVAILLAFAILPYVFAERCPRDGTRMKCKYNDFTGIVECECPKCGKKVKKKRSNVGFWLLVGSMAGRGGHGGGGFGGGFGGGSSGGGGASGGW